jgi:hypothetical protein
MGFAQAFQYADIKSLTIPVSKPFGILWMVTAFVFVISAILLLIRNEYWWAVALLAIVLSQVVIIASWKDAKFGTIANLIIVAAIIFTWGNSSFVGTHYPREKMQKDSSLTIQKN